MEAQPLDECEVIRRDSTHIQNPQNAGGEQHNLT